jgi:hypothetical protein
MMRTAAPGLARIGGGVGRSRSVGRGGGGGWARIALAAGLLLALEPAAVARAFPGEGAGRPELPPAPAPAPRPPALPPSPPPDIRPPPAPAPAPIPIQQGGKPPPPAERNPRAGEPPAGGAPPQPGSPPKPADAPTPGAPPAGEAPPPPTTPPEHPPLDPGEIEEIPRATPPCPDCKELADRINELLDELAKLARQYNDAWTRRDRDERDGYERSRAGFELEKKLADISNRIYGLSHGLEAEATAQRRAFIPDYTEYNRRVEEIRKLTEQANELRRQLVEELKGELQYQRRVTGDLRALYELELRYQKKRLELEALRRQLEQCGPKECPPRRTRRISGLPERQRTGAQAATPVAYVATDSPEWCSYEGADVELVGLTPLPGGEPPPAPAPERGAPPDSCAEARPGLDAAVAASSDALLGALGSATDVAPEAARLASRLDARDALAAACGEPASGPEEIVTPTSVVVLEPDPKSGQPPVTGLRLGCSDELRILRGAIELGIDALLAARARGGAPSVQAAGALAGMLERHAADTAACALPQAGPREPECAALARAVWERLCAAAGELVAQGEARGREPDAAAARVATLRDQARALDRACAAPPAPGEGREPVIPAPPAPEPAPPRPGSKPAPEDEAPPVVIYVKARASVLAGGQPVERPAGAQVKLLSATALGLPVPGPDVEKDAESEATTDPIQGTTDPKTGALVLAIPAADASLFGAGPDGGPLPPRDHELVVDATDETALVAELAPKGPTPLLARPDPTRQPVLRQLHPKLLPWASDVTPLGDTVFITLTLPAARRKEAEALLAKSDGVIAVEEDLCRDKELAPPNDPHYRGRGAWGQRWDDQWAIQRVGFGPGRDSAWRLVPEKAEPVTVAVIDTGLDWHHLDFDWRNLWRNPGERPGDGVDDDGNGYADDVIGWDFHGRDGHPFDHDGHGTVVAGIIAARSDNGVGIAGIDPGARIMVLRALNAFGHARASKLARALVYAADHGARVVNLSVGGEGLTTIERRAVEYALAKDVVLVAAAGNAGRDLAGQGIASLDGVIAVAATGFDDEPQAFSNSGAAVGLAAPGLDVLGLRARRTDTMRDIREVAYAAGAHVVGADRRYYRASGTSFAAPIVAGVASLVRSARPELDAAAVRRVLLQSARDVGVPGWDPQTGYGLVDARAALTADPGVFVEARIDGAEVVAGPRLRITGRADADPFGKAWLELGEGADPRRWQRVGGELRAPVRGGTLGELEPSLFAGARVWTLRLLVERAKGPRREMRFRLELD